MLRLPTVEIAPAAVDWQGLPDRFINPGEIERMVSLLRTIAPRRMAEFGVNTGRTARLILDNVPTLTEYLGIDVMPGYVPSLPVQRDEVSLEPGKHARGDPRFRMSILPNGTRNVAPEDLGGLDAVFIDGDHSREGVMHDTWLAFRAIRPGGIVIWHDYHDIGTVGVSDVLHGLYDIGNDIRHVAGTWLAFMVRCSDPAS